MIRIGNGPDGFQIWFSPSGDDSAKVLLAKGIVKETVLMTATLLLVSAIEAIKHIEKEIT